MRLLLDREQRQFTRALDDLLRAADTSRTVRAWAAGDPAPGRALWNRLADMGVFALTVPEQYDGAGHHLRELALVFVELGRHAVPGPLVETVAAAALLGRLGEDTATAAEWLPRIASGKAMVTLCVPPAAGPYALDADMADAIFVVHGEELRLADAVGPVQPSADPARRLARPLGGTVVARGRTVTGAHAHASEVAMLATAAQCLGLGRTLLDRTVEYAGQRRQFKVPIGSFQAVKHRLADTLVALEFAAPLVHAAALALASGDRDGGRQAAAAKAATGEAAYAAARTALHLHGAVGYTDDLDLSLWIRKARPLRDAWGTPSACRARVLADVGVGVGVGVTPPGGRCRAGSPRP
ncbi:acyl-CoA dehydrogenase [Streptomyces deserti]